MCVCVAAIDDVLDRNAGGFAGFLAGLRRDVERHADQIAEHERRRFVALLKDDRLGVERVLHAGAEPLVEVAAHAKRNRRRDIDDGDAGLRAVGGECRECIANAVAMPINMPASLACWSRIHCKPYRGDKPSHSH